MQVQASPEPPPGGHAPWGGYPVKALRLVWRWGTETAVVLLTAVMVATIMLQVFCRFVLGNPLSWSEELARYAFVWITFLGAAVAYRHGGTSSWRRWSCCSRAGCRRSSPGSWTR